MLQPRREHGVLWYLSGPKVNASDNLNLWVTIMVASVATKSQVKGGRSTASRHPTRQTQTWFISWVAPLVHSHTSLWLSDSEDKTKCRRVPTISAQISKLPCVPAIRRQRIERMWEDSPCIARHSSSGRRGTIMQKNKTTKNLQLQNEIRWFD